MTLHADYAAALYATARQANAAQLQAFARMANLIAAEMPSAENAAIAAIFQAEMIRRADAKGGK